jgi:hypothetical protein
MNQHFVKNANYHIFNASSKIHRFSPHILKTLETKIQSIILNTIWGIKKCHVNSYTPVKAPHIQEHNLQQLFQVNQVTSELSPYFMQYAIMSFCMTTHALDIVQLMAEPKIMI